MILDVFTKMKELVDLRFKLPFKKRQENVNQRTAVTERKVITPIITANPTQTNN